MTVRVLHIVGIMNMGGLENLIMNLYRHIDSNQVQFDFLVTREAIGIFDEEIRSLGGRIYNIPSMEKIGITKYKQNLKHFFKEKGDYHIVHCHRDALCSLYLNEAKKAGIPIRIAHSHNIKLAETKDIRGVLKSLIKYYYILYTNKFATHRFACSTEAGKWLYKKKEFLVIPNAIDTSKYNYNLNVAEMLRNQLKIEEDTFVIGHVGRFDIQKNHKFVIDTFYQLQKDIKNAMLCLVGNGILLDEMKEYVKYRGLERKVIFLGIRNDVNELMMMFDVFLFPSLFEGLGIVLIEAQATGLICLTSETVPLEADMQIDLVSYNSLNSTLEWKESLNDIYQNRKKNRKNRASKIEQIKKKGYEMATLSKQLQTFYLNESLKSN